MKEKIYDILTDHLNESPEMIHAADELTALMCYQGVKGIIFGMNLNVKFIDNYKNLFIKWMPDYSEQTILQAIEQVKKE
jgi:hypothetical protein